MQEENDILQRKSAEQEILLEGFHHFENSIL